MNKESYWFVDARRYDLEGENGRTNETTNIFDYAIGMDY